MRLVAAILISAGLLGSMAVYLHALSQRHVELHFVEPPPAKAVYTLEITPGYKSGANDPFAPNFGDAEQPSLVVKLAGQEIFATSETLEAGKPIRIESVPGLKAGANRLLVTATVSPEQSRRANAVRVVVLRGLVEHHRETIWSSPGNSVSDELLIHVGESGAPEEPHDHD
jgi:hypothetical protein